MAEPRPGDIVIHQGEQLVVVDIADYGDGEAYAPLRRQDGDPRREMNPDGSDIIIAAPHVRELTVVGHI